MKRLVLLSTCCLLVACSIGARDASPTPSLSHSAPKLHPTGSGQNASLPPAPSASSFFSTVRSPHPIPRTVRLSVPFSPQAPFANWDDPYQEACEEMALIMVHAFLEGIDLTPARADNELRALIAWEEAHGYAEDVTLEELAAIAREYYGYSTHIVYDEDVTIDVLRALLSSGFPVIVPAAGRDLGNPYYSGEGPWYHMLVLIGYQPRFFITNDPGTRRGEGYTYRNEVLLNAIHNWTGQKEDIRSGQRAVLVLSQTSASPGSGE